MRNVNMATNGKCNCRLNPTTKRLIRPGDAHIYVMGQVESVLKVAPCEHRECMYVDRRQRVVVDGEVSN